MNFTRILLISLIIGIIIGLIPGMLKEEIKISFGIGEVSATEETEDNDTSAESFWAKLQDFFLNIGESIVDLILAPFKAIQSIFNSWADQLKGWYAPILVAFVIIVIMVMYRLYSYLDDFLDGWN